MKNCSCQTQIKSHSPRKEKYPKVRQYPPVSTRVEVLAEFRGEDLRRGGSCWSLRDRNRRWKLKHQAGKQSVVFRAAETSLSPAFCGISSLSGTRTAAVCVHLQDIPGSGVVRFCCSSLTRGGSEQWSLVRLRHLKYWIRDVFRAEMSNPASSTVYLLQSAMLLYTAATSTARTHTHKHSL